jgi:hypothetical protein
MGRWSLLRVAPLLPILVWVLVGVQSCSWGNTANVKVINRSGADIKECSVSLGGSVVDIGGIKIAGASSISFAVKGDAHYGVTVEFANGERLQQQIGYVTSGFDYEDAIEIYDGRAELTRNNPKP